MKYRMFAFSLVLALISNFVLPLTSKGAGVGDEKYFTANSLYNKRLYKLAAEEYRDFLIRYPEHPKVNSAKFGLALTYYELRDYPKAKAIFSDLAEKHDVPYQDQIHNLLGQCYLVENNPSQAEAAFRWSVNNGKEKLYLDLPGVSQSSEEAPQIAMGDIQSLEPLERSIAGLIEALFQQKKWNEVIAYKDELKKLVPNSKYTVRAEFLAALACYQTKQYAKAEIILKNVTRLGDKVPFYEHALFLLAECQQLQGKLDESGKNHEIIVKKIKGKFTANSLFRLGYINFLQKKYHSAIREFSDLRSIFAKSQYYAESGIFLGRSYMQTKDYLKAQSVLGALLDNKEVGAEAHLWLGRVFIERKDYNKAIDILSAGTKKYNSGENYPKLMFELANAKMLNKQFVDSGMILADLNTKYPNIDLNRDALKFEAFSYNRAKMYKKSVVACSNYLQKYPGSKETIDIAFLKAENLFFLDDNKKALEEFKKFIPIQGKDKYTNEATYRLAQCYSDLKDWKPALTEAESLISDYSEVEGDDFYDQLYYIAGVASYQINDWRKAIKYLKEYLSSHSSESNADNALMKLGVASIKIKDYKAAENALTRLEKKFPDSKLYPYALNELGKINFLQNKNEKAEDYFNRIITYYPKTEFVKQAEYYLGWISQKSKNTKNAAKYFESIAKKYPNSDMAANSLLQLAVNQLEANDISAAESNFNKFITIYPSSPAKEEAIYYLYYCKSIDKKNDKIEDIFEPFLKKYPDSEFSASAVYESAWRARRLNNYKLAVEYYEEFLKKYPTNKLYSKVMLELAEMLYDNKDYNNAIALLDRLKASGLSKKIEPQVLYRLGWCLIGRKQDKAAIKIFDQLLQKYPKSEYTQTTSCQVGELYIKTKEYEKAYHYFKIAEAAESKDDNLQQQSLLRLGETQCLTDRWSDAQASFFKFTNKFRDSSYMDRAYMWLGWSQENLKDYTRAIKNYLKAISLAGNSEIAARSQFQIGECYFALGKYEQAVKEFVKVELAYNYPKWTSKAMLEMSQALDRMKKIEQANDILEKLIKKYPGTDEAIAAAELLDKNRTIILEQ